MFELGKSYAFHMVDGQGSSSSSTYKVVAIEGALVRLESLFDEPFILNTLSLHFIKAVPTDRDATEPFPEDSPLKPAEW